MHELEHEIAELAALIDRARHVEARQPERKLRELRAVMRRLEREQPGEKLLIFTEARDTLDYLLENLAGWGATAVCIHGGMAMAQRIEAERRFREPGVSVMVATEAAGEGINLQFCHLMVNYDIPWNPTRLEQRLGRIHRYGQTREVFMYNLVASNTREGQVLEAVFNKLERMRQQMGSDRVYDVIGETLSNARLPDIIRDAILRRKRHDLDAALDHSLPADDSALFKSATASALATRHIDIAGMARKRRQARQKKLSPAYIRGFFVAAFDNFFPKRLERRADHDWRIRYVPRQLQMPEASGRGYERAAAAYARFTFSVDEARRTGLEAVAPGHPLFEALLRHTLDQCGGDLRQGAVLLDPDNRRKGLIWLLLGTVEDGGNSVAGQTLTALYQPHDGGDLQRIGAEIFLDLDIAKPDAALDAELLRMLDDAGQVMDCFVGETLEPYMREVMARRGRETQITRRYLDESFTALIVESDGKLMDYEARGKQGKDMGVVIRDEQRRNDDLRDRKTKRLLQAEREAAIQMKPPQLLGVAAVLPADPTHQAGQLRRDADIKEAAMGVAMDYERAAGRQPRDCSAENLGYDIESRAPDGSWRCIEVKGRAGIGMVSLTDNEWRCAENLGDDFWLYIVFDIAETPQLRTIQDPARSLATEGIVRRTRYLIPPSVWRES